MSSTSKTKTIIWYGIYFILVTLVFLFSAFPSKSVQAYIQSLADERITESDFSLEKVSLSLPFGLKLHQAALAPKQGKIGLRLTADSLTIQPAPWSRIKGERGYRFKSRISGGNVKGSIDYINKKSAPPYSVRMTLSGIDIKSKQLMQGIIDRDLEGKLDGTIQYEAKNDNLYDGTGEADLIFSKGKVEITLPFLDYDAFEFDHLVIKCELKNRRLNLGQMEFKGPDLNAFLSGNISLNRQFFKSRLNLRGEIEPLPELFQKISNNPSTLEFLKKRLKSGKLTFTVSGTLDDPKMRIT
jgi:type II secretion system protein N